MATTVIIPARNEESTIGAIVATFQRHLQTKGSVFVGVDVDTTDGTARVAKEAGGIPIITTKRGKGQVVYQTLMVAAKMPGVLSRRIILCDGDYAGLTTAHITRILGPNRGMTIGVPDWPEMDVPEYVTSSWNLVSGFRCLPWELIPANAHGYLLETQLNLRAIAHGFRVKYMFMTGLKSPFQWPMTPLRMKELQRDRQWGETNGLLR